MATTDSASFGFDPSKFSAVKFDPAAFLSNKYADVLAAVSAGAKPAASSASFTPFSAPVPSTSQTLEPTVQSIYQLYPLTKQMQMDQLNTQLAYNQAAIQQEYPYLSQAAAEATSRNLAASQAMYAFKQTQPSTVQDIMASKQSQVASAADAEYRRSLGMAAQQEAATNFARRYAGQTFSTA